MQPDAEMDTLRELAERLVQASLYPGALPENLPLNVPMPPGGRLIGGVRHPPLMPPGTTEPMMGERFEVFIDAPGEAAGLASFFEAAFAAQGWRETEEQRTHREQAAAFRQRAGARGRRFPAWLTVSGGGEHSVSVSIEPRTGGVNAIRISVQPPPPAHRREFERFAQMPELIAPEGDAFHGGGGGGADGTMYREWRLESTLGIDDVEAHLVRRLAGAGWTRRDGGVQGRVGWSRWSISNEPGQEGWLLVLESTVPPRFVVHLRKLGPSGGQIGSGGSIIFTRAREITTDEEPPAGE